MSFTELTKFGYLFTKLCGDKVPYGVIIDGTSIPFNYDNRLIALLETENGWVAAVALLFCAVTAYLLGSLNFAVFCREYSITTI